MFSICIDDKGYYTEGTTENIVEVKEKPVVTNISELFAHKYNSELKIFVLDENKLKEVQVNSFDTIEPTTEERLSAIESAIDELASIIGGE